MFYKNPPLFLGYALGSYVLQRPKESKKLRVLPTWRHGEVEAFPTRTGPVGAVTGERCVGSGRRDAHCELKPSESVLYFEHKVKISVASAKDVHMESC
ncbi:uncharacterized protein LOC123849498 isoform X2 [Mirounga angustirostris]|uniref:uncharacterized protein LOC123849498 isoform X2 n=1 Tax=Mirounga angustirostris TaxID=9716 RepID=UPI00313CF5D9